MLNRLLLDDDDFRMTLSLFGTLKITYKGDRITKKASKVEKLHFQQTIDILKSKGFDISPNNEALNSLFIDYCEAILSPGPNTAIWQALFTHSPAEVANQVLETSVGNE